MTDINKLLNTTSAGILAQKLDEADGNKDGKISASIWNEFVEDKNGKKVKDFINIENAMNSITTYVVRKAHQLSTTANELCQQWIDNLNSTSTVKNEEDEEWVNDKTPIEDKTPVENKTIVPNEDESLINQDDEQTVVTSEKSPKPDITVNKNPIPLNEDEKQPQKTKDDIKSELKSKYNAHFKTRMINGQKQEYALYKNENGETIRQLINEDGTLSNLIIIADKGKKHFITEAKLQETCGITKLPDGVKCVVDKEGNLTFTGNDGTILKPHEVKTYTIPDKNIKTSKGVTNAFRAKMKNMKTGVTNLNYTIAQNSINKKANVSLIISDFCSLAQIPLGLSADKKEGTFNYKGISAKTYNVLVRKLTQKVQTLAINTAIYQDLSKKNETELTVEEKNFMKQHEEELYNFMNAK